MSVARWPHGSRIGFATFSWWKITKIAKNSTTAKGREKISTDMESFFNARLTKFKHNQVLLNKVKTYISTDDEANYWVKEPPFS